MKRIFSNNAEVVKVFFSQYQSEGRAGNIFFEDNILYSYGRHFPLAVIYNDITLINCASYSVTTAHHKGIAKSYCDDDYLEVPHPEEIKNLENLDYLKQQIKEYHKKYKNSYLHKGIYYSSTIEAINNFRKFKNIFYNVNKSELSPNEAIVAEIDEKLAIFRAEQEKRRVEGVLLPKNLFRDFKNNKLTPEKILKAKNAEVRSLLLKQYGYGRLISHFEHKIIDRDLKRDYELILLKTPKTEKIENRWNGNITELPEDIMLIKVKDTSTGTFYVLRVPLTVKTCTEALAWTFGMSESEYKLEVEA